MQHHPPRKRRPSKSVYDRAKAPPLAPKSKRPPIGSFRFTSEAGGKLTAEQQEFGRAMLDYMDAYRRPFPAWSEVLDVVYALGYRRVAAAK